MNEFLPGVFTWPQFSERHGYDFNGWLVRDAAGNVCIDPVEPTDAVLADLVREGVARILITNRNHFRAAARVKEATAARIAAHPADSGFIRKNGVPVDDALWAGQHVGPFTVVAAPGKSPGEIALYWAERRILVVGDACVGKPPGALALLPEKVIDDLPTLRHSLRRLARLDFEALLLGDGAPLATGGRQALSALVGGFEGETT